MSAMLHKGKPIEKLAQSKSQNIIIEVTLKHIFFNYPIDD